MAYSWAPLKPLAKNEYSFVVRKIPFASAPMCGKSPMHGQFGWTGVPFRPSLVASML